MSIDMSRLRQVPVRDVWKSEPRHFTLWLLANADVLADTLGMELELTEAEHQVGEFSLDLIGRDLGSGGVVIVENQLEKTDHGHLGQLLTYAGGTDPETIVWCAPSFREQHRAALDWLNLHTDEETRFFGVEVSAVQIDDSRPAPLFRVVAKPNDWTKQVHAEKAASLSGKGVAYVEFWAELLRRIRESHPDWTSKTTGSRSNWISLPFGVSWASYGFVFTQTGPRIELYFDTGDAAATQEQFAKFAALSEPLDAAFGEPLKYDPIPGKRACRIHVDRAEGGDVTQTDDWDAFMDWFVETMMRFRSATQHVKSLIDGQA